MGTSRSGSVGSSTRWKVTRDEVKALADAALAGIPMSIPQITAAPQGGRSGSTKKGRSVPVKRKRRKMAGAAGGAGGGAGGSGGAGIVRDESVTPATATASVPRSIRALGQRIAAVGASDKRFVPQMGDCAVRVAIETLLGLFTAATIKYRTQRDTESLFAEYGISGTRNVANALVRALDQRYRDDIIKKCKRATDSTDNARQAMERTLTDILSPDRTADAFVKLSAEDIHNALRKTSSMKIVERFYAHYLYNTMKMLVSSLHAEISPTAETNVMNGLRDTYCDYVAKQIVKRAGEKGWRAGEIASKSNEWADLLVAEEAHA